MVKKVPLIIAAALCCGLLYGCSSPVPAISVGTTALKTDTFSTGYVTAGVAQAQSAVDVIPQYPGKVTATYKNVGDTVKKGDVLFRIDDTLLKAQISSAEAALGQANAGVGQANAGVKTATTAVTQANHALTSAQIGLTATQKGSVPATLLQYQSAVSNAQIGYNSAVKAQQLAQQAYDGATAGAKAGVVDQATVLSAQSALNQANAAVSSAKLGLSTAQKNLQIYNSVVSKQSVAASQSTVNSASSGVDAAHNAVNTANAAVDSAKAAVSTAQSQINTLNDELKYYTVTAPIAGVVTAKNVVTGGMVGQTAPAYSISDPSHITLTTAVPLSEINTLTMGGAAQVFYSDGTSANGSITAISQTANPAKLYMVQVNVDNADKKLTPSMDVTIILVATQTQSLVVPDDAVVTQGQDSYVFANVNGKAKKISVEVVGKNPYETAIKATNGGLDDSTQIVTTNADMLQDGDSIQVKN